MSHFTRILRQIRCSAAVSVNKTRLRVNRHLQLTLLRSRVLRKDVQDERGAVENLDARLFPTEFTLKTALLSGAELVVKYYRTNVQLVHGSLDLLHLVGNGTSEIDQNTNEFFTTRCRRHHASDVVSLPRLQQSVELPISARLNACRFKRKIFTHFCCCGCTCRTWSVGKRFVRHPWTKGRTSSVRDNDKRGHPRTEQHNGRRKANGAVRAGAIPKQPHD